MSAQKLRLLKVIVQPIFVLDDGEFIESFDQAPVEVSAKDWPEYSAITFPREVDSYEKSLEKNIN